MMLSITGEAESCNPSCHGVGCPLAATASPPLARMAAIATAKAVNRFNTSIVISLRGRNRP
jgi:hypothetical protein